jgi:hypothetical protein
VVQLKRVPIGEADPYLFLGLLGKQVIHPGGRKATKELLGLAALAPGQHPPIGSSRWKCCVCDVHFIVLSEIRGKAASRPASPWSS